MSQTTPKKATRKAARRPIESTLSPQDADSEEPSDSPYLHSLKYQETARQIAAELLALDNEVCRLLDELMLEDEFRSPAS